MLLGNVYQISTSSSERVINKIDKFDPDNSGKI